MAEAVQARVGAAKFGVGGFGCHLFCIRKSLVNCRLHSRQIRTYPPVGAGDTPSDTTSAEINANNYG